jgi:hypothetical protein
LLGLLFGRRWPAKRAALSAERLGVYRHALIGILEGELGELVGAHEHDNV